jgi:hypothetical protein
MKHGVLLLALIVLSTSASAQTPQTPTTRSQTSAAGAAGVAARMQSLGYTDVHNLHRGPDGKWVGDAQRNGVPVTVTAEPQGGITAR